MEDILVGDSRRPEVLGPDPEIIDLARRILAQHEIIIKVNSELLPRLVGAPLVYYPQPPAEEK